MSSFCLIPGGGKNTHKTVAKKVQVAQTWDFRAQVANVAHDFAHDFEKKDFKGLQWILPRGIKRTSCW